MKHNTFLALALSALLLTACSAPAAESAAPTPAAYESQVPAAVSVGKPLHHLNSGGTAPQIGITDSAAYLPMKFGCILLATKIDFATAQQEILCNADGCTHTDETCLAFMAADDDALQQGTGSTGLSAEGPHPSMSGSMSARRTAATVTRLSRTAVSSSWIARCP